LIPLKASSNPSVLAGIAVMGGGLRPSTETLHLSDSFGFVLSDGCEPGEVGFEIEALAKSEVLGFAPV
jgi:hypothetical protein